MSEEAQRAAQAWVDFITMLQRQAFHALNNGAIPDWRYHEVWQALEDLR